MSLLPARHACGLWYVELCQLPKLYRLGQLAVLPACEVVVVLGVAGK